MISFQDFAPRPLPTPGVGFSQAVRFETFDQAVVAANAWIQQYGVQVINVETVVLPSVYKPNAQGTLDSNLHTMADGSSHWYQILRVWYVVPG